MDNNCTAQQVDYSPEFLNRIVLRGIVTDIHDEHLDGDMKFSRISLYTAYKYAVDAYVEKTHFSVAVFPNIVGTGSRGVKKGSEVYITGRLRMARRVGSGDALLPEVVADSVEAL